MSPAAVRLRPTGTKAWPLPVYLAALILFCGASYLAMTSAVAVVLFAPR